MLEVRDRLTIDIIDNVQSSVNVLAGHFTKFTIAEDWPNGSYFREAPV